MSSRQKGDGWLLNWFLPYAFYYAFQHRKEHKFPFVLMLATLLSFVIVGGAWIVVRSSLPMVTQQQDSVEQWTGYQLAESIYLTQDNQLISNEEWVITHKELMLPKESEEVRLTTPSVVHSYQDPATKTFINEEVKVPSLRIIQVGRSTEFIFETDGQPLKLIANIDRKETPATSVDQATIQQVIREAWPDSRPHLSFKVGAIRSISDKQYIAGLQLFDGRTLIKEITVTIDVRLNKPILNHRSLLVLRRFLSDYQGPKPAQTARQTLNLSEFQAISRQYEQKRLNVIKTDETKQQGVFASISNKVLVIRKSLGSGIVDVQIPLQLVERLEFETLEVQVRTILPEPDVIYIEESEVALPQLTTESAAVKESPVTAGAITSKVEQKAELLKQPEDPYAKWVGKQVNVVKTNGQTRIGTLIAVKPGKSLTLQLLNGGLEVQIPQGEVANVTIVK
jgi:hypothetical protein